MYEQSVSQSVSDADLKYGAELRKSLEQYKSQVFVQRKMQRNKQKYDLMFKSNSSSDERREVKQQLRDQANDLIRDPE